MVVTKVNKLKETMKKSVMMQINNLVYSHEEKLNKGKL